MQSAGARIRASVRFRLCANVEGCKHPSQCHDAQDGMKPNTLSANLQVSNLPPRNPTPQPFPNPSLNHRQCPLIIALSQTQTYKMTNAYITSRALTQQAPGVTPIPHPSLATQCSPIINRKRAGSEHGPSKSDLFPRAETNETIQRACLRESRQGGQEDGVDRGLIIYLPRRGKSAVSYCLV